MTLEFGFTEESCNTQFAPLAALLALYQQNQTLKPLELVAMGMKTRDYSPTSKLEQVLFSILAGCENIAAVDTMLRPEHVLASVWELGQFTSQSNLSRMLDAVSLTNIEQLRQAIDTIWHPISGVRTHDWRGFLWLDFDLSGLPCGKLAEESQKGYFSGKKTSLGDSWPELVLSNTLKPYGLTCLLAIVTPPVACNQLSRRPKVH